MYCKGEVLPWGVQCVAPPSGSLCGETKLHLSASGRRVGFGLEHSMQEVVEECIGEILLMAVPLVLLFHRFTIW